MAVDYRYDDELTKIQMYKLHPQYLPFIGTEYEKYRILHVGESHYIDQKDEPVLFDITYFWNHWWTDECKELSAVYGGNFDTRGVIDRAYMAGITDRGFRIFTNFIKSFRTIVLNENADDISQLYRYAAFMNFFQMPSVYSGEKYWESIYRSAKNFGNKNLANDMWDKCVEESSKTLDSVIDILNPRAVVFTSISAWEAYTTNNCSRHKDDSCIVVTSHPGAPYSWNKPLKRFDGKTGKEHFEIELQRIYGED